MDDATIAILGIAVSCALLGMLVGWMGGWSEGRAQMRRELTKARELRAKRQKEAP